MGERAGKKVLVMPTSADGLRGSDRQIALNAEAIYLRDALLGSLELIDVFEEHGSPVLVADGQLRPVGARELRWLVEELFVEKYTVRTVGGQYQVEYRPVRPSEAAIRTMLTAEAKYGGLIGKLPPLTVEPQMSVAPEPASVLPDDHPEILASRRTQARFANPDARRDLESARGREVSARYARQQQQAAAEPIETQVVESYPVFAPPKPAEPTPSVAD
jgi:hypothetical protein